MKHAAKLDINGQAIGTAEYSKNALLLLQSLKVSSLARVNRIAEMIKQWRFWAQRQRQRRELMGLSDELLKDVGITRYDAMKEGQKRPWEE